MTWHVDQKVLEGYQGGLVDRVTAASLEAHLTACAECRSRLVVDTEWLEESWKGVVERVEPGSPLLVERFLTFMGVPAHLARVMAVTPSLRPSWLIAMALSLLFAGLASRLTQPAGLDLLLVLAPLVPVAGVAVAYGRLGDPAHEITVAAPVDPLRLLLLRAAIVTGAAVALSLIIDLAIPSSEGTGLWILPAFALTLFTLALGTRLTMWVAATSSAAAWLVFMALVAAQNQGRLISELVGGTQVFFVALAMTAAYMLVRNGDAYRRGDER